MHRKDGVVLSSIFLLSILVVGSFGLLVDYENSHQQPGLLVSEPDSYDAVLAGIPHAPIAIDGDANFSATAIIEGWAGDGSSETPYVISGLDIDLAGGAGHCININNTQVNFTIINCNLTGASVNPGAGIYMNNVTNCKIIDNTFFDDYYGIYFIECDNNTISGNVLDGNTWGIHLNYAESNLVNNNTCTNHWRGIVISLSTLNTVTNNTCNYNDASGIAISESTFCTVENNICNHQSYNGIDVLSANSNLIMNNTCNSNSDTGIYIYDSEYIIVTNNTCSSNSGSGIDLDYSLFCTMRINTCMNDDEGIRITGASQSSITNNSCSDNINGISIVLSASENLLENNTVRNNMHGMLFDELSEFCTVVNNSYVSNSYGIYVGQAYGHEFLWNALQDNSVNAFDDYGASFFDYNYWADYSGVDDNGDGFGDVPYSFSSNSDSHPLMYLPYPPPRWISSTPEDTIIEFPYSFHYHLNATASTPLFWSVNDTTRFTINGNGVLESWGSIPVGVYGLRVTVSNIYGLFLSTVFRVSVVRDASNPPGWGTILTNQVLNYDEEFEYQVIAVDPSGIDYWQLNDTTHFTLQSSFYIDGSTACIKNKTVLEPGLYPLKLTVYDIYGNSLSGEFTITVIPPQEDTIPPTWVTFNIAQTIEYGQPMEIQVEAWDSSGIDHWWMNDTEHFTLDEYGLIRNTVVLESGVYKLEIRAYDPHDNYCSAILVVTVLEASSTTTAPITSTTHPTTPSHPGGMDPLVALVMGVGLGGGLVMIVGIVVMFREGILSRLKRK